MAKRKVAKSKQKAKQKQTQPKKLTVRQQKQQAKKQQKKQKKELEKQRQQAEQKRLADKKQKQFLGKANKIEKEIKEKFRVATEEINKQIEAQQEAEKERKRQAEFERKRRIKDEIEKLKAKEIQQDDLVYDKLSNLIDMYPGKGAIILKKVLEHEISSYGYHETMAAIRQVDDNIMALAEVICYYEEDSTVLNRAIVNFIDLLRGTIPTVKESQEISDLMDELDQMEV
jgi:hypothetical protein